MRRVGFCILALALAGCGSVEDEPTKKGSAKVLSDGLMSLSGEAPDDVYSAHRVHDDDAVTYILDYVNPSLNTDLRFNVENDDAATVAYPFLREAGLRCAHLFDHVRPKNSVMDRSDFETYLKAEQKLIHPGSFSTYSGTIRSAARLSGIVIDEDELRTDRIENIREAASLGREEDATSAMHSLVENGLSSMIGDCRRFAGTGISVPFINSMTLQESWELTSRKGGELVTHSLFEPTALIEAVSEKLLEGASSLN